MVRRQSRDEEKLVNSILEGDIRLTVGQAEQLLMDAVKPRRRRRNLVEPTVKRWTLPIPYTFDGSHSQDFFFFFSSKIVSFFTIVVVVVYSSNRKCIRTAHIAEKDAFCNRENSGVCECVIK